MMRRHDESLHDGVEKKKSQISDMRVDVFWPIS